MLASISQEPKELAKDTSYEAAHQSQVNLTQGTEWILSTLGDLANFCAFNQLDDVETTLRRAIWEASLQLEQSQQNTAL